MDFAAVFEEGGDVGAFFPHVVVHRGLYFVAQGHDIGAGDDVVVKLLFGGAAKDQASGAAVVQLIKNGGPYPRDIITLKALENAAAIVAATGPHTAGPFQINLSPLGITPIGLVTFPAYP